VKATTVSELLATATGKAHRGDPVLPVSGGPAGNASITAWLGLILLPLFVIEGITLLSLHELLNVHIFVGAFLLPIVLAKTISTGYRAVRYYTGNDPYLEAGPPPLLLRLLGPLVVLTGLAVVGTGIALIALGTDGTFSVLFTALGFQVSALTLHQVAAITWAIVTGIHLLARFVPALQLATGRRHGVNQRLPGVVGRVAVLGGLLIVATGTGVLLLHLGHDWTSTSLFGHHRRGG